MLLLQKKRFYSENLKLAIPIIIANIGQSTVAIIDNIMVGRLGAIELAASAFASILITNILVFGMRIAMSLTPITGECYAAGNHRTASKYFQNSLLLNFSIGTLLALAMIFGTPLLYKMGQEKVVIDSCINYYKIVAISMIPYMIFLSFKQFMEGVGNTKVSMSITIASNIINIVLNYIFIYGKFGAPEMGIDGAAVATLISRIFMPITFFVYMRRDHSKARYLSFFSHRNLSRGNHSQLLNVGLPISAQMTVEVVALSATAIMMGWIGVDALAANQIVLSVMGFMFMVTCGIASAVTILTSHEMGSKNWENIKSFTKAGLQMSVGFMAISALLFIFVGRFIAMAYSSDMGVIDIAASIFAVAAMFELLDGYQITMLGALRGIQDVRSPMVISIISYTLLNIPAAYLLGFTFNLGVEGIWSGFFVGLLSACILLTWRFNFAINKKIKTI